VVCWNDAVFQYSVLSVVPTTRTYKPLMQTNCAKETSWFVGDTMGCGVHLTVSRRTQKLAAGRLAGIDEPRTFNATCSDLTEIFYFLFWTAAISFAADKDVRFWGVEYEVLCGRFCSPRRRTSLLQGAYRSLPLADRYRVGAVDPLSTQRTRDNLLPPKRSPISELRPISHCIRLKAYKRATSKCQVAY